VLHVVAQAGAAAAGQAQQVGLARVGEVVDVAPVRRGWALAALCLEQLPDDGVAAAAGLAQQVEVVAAVRDVEPDLDRLDRAAVDLRRVQVASSALLAMPRLTGSQRV